MLVTFYKPVHVKSEPFQIIAIGREETAWKKNEGGRVGQRVEREPDSKRVKAL